MIEFRPGGGLCDWAKHFIHIAQTADVGDVLPIDMAAFKSRVSHVYTSKLHAPEKMNAKKKKYVNSSYK